MYIRKKTALFVLFLLIGLGLIFLGHFTHHNYAMGLKKFVPLPSPSLFVPVWFLLYLVLGIAFWIIFTLPKTAKRVQALNLFYFQLILNVIWILLFFSHYPLMGLIDATALFLFAFATTLLFWSLSTLAGILFIPYLIWIGYGFLFNVLSYLT